MKLNSLLLVLFLSLFGQQVFASQVYTRSQANHAEKIKQAKCVAYPGYCEIEIINDSYSNVSVYGTLDNGSIVDFNVFRYDEPHYISLYYYSYCHRGMYLTIQDRYGIVYSGWTRVDSTVRIVPSLIRGVNVEIH